MNEMMPETVKERLDREQYFADWQKQLRERYNYCVNNLIKHEL